MPHRSSTLSRGVGHQDYRSGHSRRSRIAAHAQRRHSSGLGNDLSEMPRKGTASPLWHSPTAGRRLGLLPSRRADHRSSRRHHRANLARVPPQSCDSESDGDRRAMPDRRDHHLLVLRRQSQHSRAGRSISSPACRRQGRPRDPSGRAGSNALAGGDRGKERHAGATAAHQDCRGEGDAPALRRSPSPG